MYKLQLRDGIDTVDFIGDTSNTFYLVDESFSMGDPESKEYDTEYIAAWGEVMDARRYGPREVSFGVAIKGTTRASVIDSFDRLFRMASRSLTFRHFSGGSYQDQYSYNPETDKVIFGGQGLQLKIQFGDRNSSSVVGEFGQSYTEVNDTSFYVLSMDVSGANVLSSEFTRGADGHYMTIGAEVRLVCSSFGYGNPIKVTMPAGLDTSGFRAVPSPMQSGYFGARFVIPSSQIPGSGEALTQFTMNVHKLPDLSSGDGVIIARDAGKSLANCPSAFVSVSDYQTSNASAYIIPVGYSTSGNNYYDVEVVANNPVQVRHRTNGGSWSSTTTPSAFQLISVNSDFGYYVTTSNLNGIVNAGTVSRSFSTSYVFYKNAQSNITASFLDDVGYSVQEATIMVPSGVHGKYKVMFGVLSSQELEYRMLVRYAPSGYSTQGYTTNWRSQSPTSNSGLIDMGVIDCSPASMPQTSIPGGIVPIRLSISARLIEQTATGTVTPFGVWFIPVGDDRSYLRAKWRVSSDWDGFQLVSNFDPRNPLMGMVNREYRTGFNGSNINSMVNGLDETHEGSPITLVPGVDNTILVIPLLSSYSDYRTGLPATGIGTGTTTMSIRPSYFIAR